MKTNTFFTAFLARAAMVLLLVMMTSATWAQSVIGSEVISGFTATDGTGDSAEEGFACLVDGHYTENDFSKWCTDSDMNTFDDEKDECWFVDFHSDGPITISRYILTSANDAREYPGRNPIRWKIKAKLQMKDDWVTVADVSEDYTIGENDYTDYEFDLDIQGTYQYFRFEVFESQEDLEIQLAELRFIGSIDLTQIAGATVEGLQRYYNYTGSTIDISYTVTGADGNLLEEGTHYTAAITNSSGTTVTEVKDKGQYKLTLTAVPGGGYTGVKEIGFDVAPWAGQGGFCGNPAKNGGRNLYYELTEYKGGKMLTVYVNPDAAGNDFTMEDYKDSNHPWEEDKGDIIKVVISNGVTSIGNKAFYDCVKLETVTIPNSVTSIGQYAFEGTSWLNNQEGVVYINNVAYCYRGEMPEGTTITLNDGTVAVGEGAFQHCGNLKAVVIPNSVTSIGNSAFNGCSDLTGLALGNGVTSIGEYAFQYCSSLTSLSIPNSVTSIGNNAFEGCSALSTLDLGNGVTSIGESAFQNCSALTTLTLGSSVTSIGKYAFQSCSELTSLNIASGAIGEKAFQLCYNLITLTIGSGVTSIGDYAFQGCNDLTSLSIGSGAIGENAFQFCYGLTNLALGNGVTSIGESAFENCSALPSVSIPNSVTSIGESAFQFCSALTSLYIGSGAIGESAFRNCSELTSLTIGNGVTSIGESAFQFCSALTSLYIGSGAIGDDAFRNCSELTSLTIGNGVTSIGESAFQNCRKLPDVYCYADPIDFSWEGGGAGNFQEGKATLFHVFDAEAWSGQFADANVTFVGGLTVRFLDDADNTELIASFVNQNRSVTLVGRSIYKDGNWTTLCLPFNLSSLTGTPLEGFTVRELDTVNPHDGHMTGLDGGTLYLNFKDATGIVAGRPYIVSKSETGGTPRYKATDGTQGSMSSQGYDKLLDGSTQTYRWRTDISKKASFCEFHTYDAHPDTAALVNVTGYTLTTGNQSTDFDPRVWTLQGKLNKNDAWTVIDSRNVNVNSVDALPAGRTATKSYNVQHPGTYRYFRFEVSQTNGQYMCLTELELNAKLVPVLTDPTFTGVTLSSAEPSSVTSADNAVSFVGNYDSTALKAHDGTVLYLDTSNTLHHPSSAMTIGSSYPLFRLNDGLAVSLMGDVSGDGRVTVSDVMMMVDDVLGLTANGFKAKHADVNGDGKVTVSDVMAVVDMILFEQNGEKQLLDGINTGDSGITYGE